MRNLRKIFEHIAFYNRSPALEIKDLRERVLASNALAVDDRAMLGKILDAVVAIAEGDEDKASKKAATTEG